MRHKYYRFIEVFLNLHTYLYADTEGYRAIALLPRQIFFFIFYFFYDKNSKKINFFL